MIRPIARSMVEYVPEIKSSAKAVADLWQHVSLKFRRRAFYWLELGDYQPMSLATYPSRLHLSLCIAFTRCDEELRKIPV